MDRPQNQNLIVWFRCQLCRGSFQTVNEFIEHKEQWHFIEFQKINSNCMIFEEFTANEKEPADKTQATTVVLSSDANLQSQTEIQAGPGPEPEKEVVSRHGASERVQGQAFAQVIDPFVLITRLTLKEIQVASQKSRPSSKKPKSVRSSIRRKKKKTTTTTTKSKSFQCPKAGCSKKCETLRSRNIHFAMHGKSTSNGRQRDRPFHCAHPGCGKSFRRKEGVKKHLKTHVDPRDRRAFPCQICSKVFYRKGYLDIHFREVHGKARPFPCPQPGCMKSFKRKATVMFHFETHADPRDRPTFPCQVCSRVCYRKDYLDKHYREVHGEDLSFSCPQPGCTKSFKRKVAVRNHFKTHVVPSDRPLFACKICQLPYWHLESLKKHCLVVHGAEAATCQA